MNLLLPYWIRTVVLTTTLFAFSGLASAGEESGKWLCPEAGYRLRVTPEKADKVGSVDLRRLLLPTSPDSGVRVFDSAGKQVRHSHCHKRT